MRDHEGDTLAAIDRSDWHARSAQDTLSLLQADPQGLSAREAAARLERYGPNRLARAKGRSPLTRLLTQFHNLLIYALIAAAVLAGAIGHLVDAAVIATVVVVNAIVGFIQEGKAEKALEAGDRAPADLRLIRARHLRIDESILTGESVPVDKSCEPAAQDAPVGDRPANRDQQAGGDTR